MKNLTLYTRAAYVALFSILLLSSYTGRLMGKEDAPEQSNAPHQRLTGREDMCLRRYAEDDIEANLKLKKIGSPVTVEKVERGYVTLVVTGINPFSYEAIRAIQAGKKTYFIQKSIDPSVAVLTRTESRIKRIPGVKTVLWTADKKVTSTSSAGYTARYSGTGASVTDACPKRTPR